MTTHDMQQKRIMVDGRVLYNKLKRFMIGYPDENNIHHVHSPKALFKANFYHIITSYLQRANTTEVEYNSLKVYVESKIRAYAKIHKICIVCLVVILIAMTFLAINYYQENADKKYLHIIALWVLAIVLYGIFYSAYRTYSGVRRTIWEICDKKLKTICEQN